MLNSVSCFSFIFYICILHKLSSQNLYDILTYVDKEEHFLNSFAFIWLLLLQKLQIESGRQSLHRTSHSKSMQRKAAEVLTVLNSKDEYVLFH